MERTIIQSFDKYGNLLLATWHTSAGSVFAELEAYRARMIRGEVSRVEVCEPGMPMRIIYTPKECK